ncbi:MAG: aspartate/glutamate racemase family protein [Clostridia bacterium]|nr:aspartate/glutamate racemase family protein [Clostridia bacterium]
MRVGIFDSGVGGLASLEYFRTMMPTVDTVFYADSENAPYGTKSEEELISLVTADIGLLLSLGAERVLMACCTASSVYDRLDEKYRAVAVPIILPTAIGACELSQTGRIGVLSTEATRRSGAFVRAIKRIRPDAEVISASAGELVALAEAGACDGNLGARGYRILRDALSPFVGSNIDTLILGCTHFGRFGESVERILGVRTVDSAREGARALLRCCMSEEKI